MNKEKMFSFDIKKKVFLGSRQGSILAYSLIILSMMLAIATSLSIATILAKKSASGTEFSVQSLQTADSGVQLALKKINNNLDKKINNGAIFGGGNCSDVGGVATIAAQGIPNAGTYELSFYKKDVVTGVSCNDDMKAIEAIKSVGVYRDTVRVITVAVAAPPCGGIPLKAGVPTLTDVRGSESIDYPVVEIGDKCWMAENLRTKMDINGTALRLWTVGGFVNVDYFCPPMISTPNLRDCGVSNVNKLGYLYNWAAAMGINSSFNTMDYTYATEGGRKAGLKIRGLCPLGWHIPSDFDLINDDMAKLELFGGGLKETLYTSWKFPNTGATNSTLFTAVPTGIFAGGWNDYGVVSYLWSSLDEQGTNKAWHRRLVNTGATFGRYTISGDKINGLSVRCVKD